MTIKQCSQRSLQFISIADKSTNGIFNNCDKLVLLHKKDEDRLSKILSINYVSIDDYIFQLEDYLHARNLGFPWAIVCFPREMKLCVHFFKARGLLSARYLPYQLVDTSSFIPPPMIGAILFFSKPDLYQLSSKSKIFDLAWKTLAAKDENKKWISFPPMPAATWVRLSISEENRIYPELSKTVRW